MGVTMSIDKLSAGSSYDYLTRQVAALDSTEKGNPGLAAYDADRDEAPRRVDRFRDSWNRRPHPPGTR
jgi:hypothetical protein